MNFLGGSLPNVMFIIGVLAIGLGLGIELKLVPLNKEIDKTGRIGAMVVGALLVAGSLYLYLNPSLTNPTQPAPATVNAALAPAQAVPSATTGLIATEPTAAPPTIPAAAAPTSGEAPTAAPSATSAPLPTAVPPTPIPPVTVPDLHSFDEKGAQDALAKVGLHARKVDKCTGSDQGDPKAKKHRILCQNPTANAAVPLGSTVEYVMR